MTSNYSARHYVSQVLLLEMMSALFFVIQNPYRERF